MISPHQSSQSNANSKGDLLPSTDIDTLASTTRSREAALLSAAVTLAPGLPGARSSVSPACRQHSPVTKWIVPHMAAIFSTVRQSYSGGTATRSRSGTLVSLAACSHSTAASYGDMPFFAYFDARTDANLSHTCIRAAASISAVLPASRVVLGVVVLIVDPPRLVRRSRPLRGTTGERGCRYAPVRSPGLSLARLAATRAMSSLLRCQPVTR